MKRIAIVLGTRHEITKMSPVVRACERQGDVDWSVRHTGRDCSCDVGRVFPGGLGLPDAKDNRDAAKNDGNVRECIRYGGL